jgi:hypothetical protein
MALAVSHVRPTPHSPPGTRHEWCGVLWCAVVCCAVLCCGACPGRGALSQVVLSDTSAGFRCSPTSHLVYERLLEMMGIGAKGSSDFVMLRKEFYGAVEEVRNRVAATRTPRTV